VRTAGFSLAVSTWLIERTGDKAAPGYWTAFAGVCGLVATLLLYRRGAVAVAAAH
jgi:MHS family citrate/tricarballylate:H+ symporter-like MFS transporter